MDLIQGKIVTYDTQTMKGRARIVGIATTGAAVIGRIVILEDLSENLPNREYPFTHFACAEVHLSEK